MRNAVFVLSAIAAGVLDNILMRDLGWGGNWTYVVPGTIVGMAVAWLIIGATWRNLLLLPAWSMIEDFSAITILQAFPWFPREDWFAPFSTPLWWGIPAGYFAAMIALAVWVMLKPQAVGGTDGTCR